MRAFQLRGAPAGTWRQPSRSRSVCPLRVVQRSHVLHAARRAVREPMGRNLSVRCEQFSLRAKPCVFSRRSRPCRLLRRDHAGTACNFDSMSSGVITRANGADRAASRPGCSARGVFSPVINLYGLAPVGLKRGAINRWCRSAYVESRHVFHRRRAGQAMPG